MIEYETKIKTVEIPAFYIDNIPTCSVHVGPETTCPMLGFKHFGTRPVCMFGEQVDLTRVFNIIPHVECRIHYGR